jgi:hypothetical protein
MLRTMSQFILKDSIIYYTSYLCMVLIKYVSWVDKMPLTVLSFGHCISYFMLAICLLVLE